MLLKLESIVETLKWENEKARVRLVPPVKPTIRKWVFYRSGQIDPKSLEFFDKILGSLKLLPNSYQVVTDKSKLASLTAKICVSFGESPSFCKADTKISAPELETLSSQPEEKRKLWLKLKALI